MEPEVHSTNDAQEDEGYGGLLSAWGSSWGWVLFFGLLTLIAGIVVLVYPGHALAAVGIIFGLQLFLVGLFRLVMAFTPAAAHHRVFNILVGILSVIVGIFCLRHVFQTVVILTLILGVFWVAYGIMGLIAGVGVPRLPNRGLTIATGVISFIAGTFVLAYPVGSSLALALILGIWLVVFGAMAIVDSFLLRRRLDGRR